MLANTSLKSTIIISVIFCLTLGVLEPSAFARSQDSSQNAGTLEASLQTPAATPAVKVANPADTRPQPAHKSGKKKWFVILAVAVGAVVAVVLTQKKKTTTPTITVGPPTIG